MGEQGREPHDDAPTPEDPQQPGPPGADADAAPGGSGSPGSLDERFEAILAHWDEDAPTSGSARLDHLDLTFRHLPGPLAQTPSEDEGWRRHTPPEVDEHFEPPDPQLPPAHDATYWLALAGLTLGPLVVIWAAVVSGNPDPGWWVLLGIVATIGGFTLMVLRGSGERDPDDDGAVV